MRLLCRYIKSGINDADLSFLLCNGDFSLLTEKYFEGVFCKALLRACFYFYSISASTPSQQTLAGGKRAYNLGIFLKGLKTRGRALIQSLSQVNEEDSALSVEQVATIRR